MTERNVRYNGIVFRCIVVILALNALFRSPYSRKTETLILNESLVRPPVKFEEEKDVPAVLRTARTNEKRFPWADIVDPRLCPSAVQSPSTYIPMQKCCSFESKSGNGRVSCLPSLVVLGAQKAGTTALHGYLLLHPNIRGARKKEMHVFDFDRNYENLSRRLAEWLPASTKTDAENFVVVDSTPSYLADRDACRRMQNTLSDKARFVVILRNPVERLWSEVNMKRRRIAAQQEFLEVILPSHFAIIQTCIQAKSKLVNLDVFRACLPESLAHHGRIVAFYRFLISTDRVAFAQTCLTDQEAAKSCVLGPYRGRILNETLPDIPRVIFEEMVKLKRRLRDCCSKDNGIEQDGDGIGCGSTCFPKTGMMSDISKNFVWRSLYFPQLVHCTAYIQRERILVIDASELKHNPVETVQRVFAHAGLQQLDSQSLTPEKSVEAFRRLYPEFEAVSGWGRRTGLVSKGEEEIPGEVRYALDEFFRPYNRKLFTEFLRIEPFEGWSV